jgi:protein-tyrosine-phosphatase
MHSLQMVCRKARRRSRMGAALASAPASVLFSSAGSSAAVVE